jgi:hypothetical protein
MARATFVKKARKDYPEHDIKKGESYWWWKFRFGSKNYSKTKPRPSQLTQSEFLGTIYDIHDTLQGMTIEDISEDCLQEVIDELTQLGEETDERLNNMPDQLQDAPTGELLQSRVDEVDSMVSELEGVDLSIDEEDIKNDVKENNEIEDDESEEDYNERISGLQEETINERKEEILSEIQNINYCGE